MTLEQATVLVVGGAGDIGGAVVRRARQLGARTLIWDLREPDDVDPQHFRRLDAADEDEVGRGFVRLAEDRLLPDVLINAAGVFAQLKPFDALDLSGLLQILKINAGSCFLTCQTLLRHRPKQVSIVNISSAMSQRPIPMAAAYSASKAAIDSLTRSIALEYAQHNVRANAVNPGPVRGSMLDSGLSDMAEQAGCQTTDLEAGILQAIPQSRLIAPEEVAATALFLADDSASSITGQTINVCGGYQL